MTRSRWPSVEWGDIEDWYRKRIEPSECRRISTDLGVRSQEHEARNGEGGNCFLQERMP